MKLDIDERANAVYLYLTDGEVAKSKVLEPGVNYDYDSEGNLRGIEVIHARSVFGDLSTLTAERMRSVFIATYARPNRKAA